MLIPQYPKLLHIGHRSIKTIFSSSVEVQEKIDGSQFSFMKLNDKIIFRSKNVEFDLTNAPDLFRPSIANILLNEKNVEEGYIYRAESIKNKRHNMLEYERAPIGNTIIFDIQKMPYGSQDYLSHEEICQHCSKINCEPIKSFGTHLINDIDETGPWMESISQLGKTKIEGLVFKNYNQYTYEGNAMMAKLVSNEFKETMVKSIKGDTEKIDIFESIASSLKTEARYRKATQHLAERNELKNSLSDIGLIIREFQKDVKEEEEDYIKECLFGHFWKKISRNIVNDIPDWYKNKLESQETRSPIPENGC